MTDKDEILTQFLLKELELCQKNRDHWVVWQWQIGSLFLGLSLAAFWLATQFRTGIEAIAFAFFSIALMLTWTFALYNRGAFYSEVSLKTAQDIEKKILELAKDHITPDLLLHTRINTEDKKPWKEKRWCIRATWGVLLFNTIVIVAWVILILIRLTLS